MIVQVSQFDQDGTGDIDYMEFMTLVSTKVAKAADLVTVVKQSLATAADDDDEAGLRLRAPKRIALEHQQQMSQLGHAPALITPKYQT